MTQAQPVPEELVALQRDFGDAIRSPLGIAGGIDARRAKTEACARRIVGVDARDVDERLGTYRRQYWFRLLTAFHSEFPATSRIVGLTRFNVFVERFLVDRAPTSADLHRAADGFADWATPRADALAGGRAKAASVASALAIDEAFRGLFRAPATRPFVPDSTRAASLASCRLVLARGARLVSDAHGILAVRRRVASEPTLERVPVAGRPTAHVALLRSPDSIGEWPLDPLQARLYEECVATSVGDALACVDAERRGRSASEVDELVRVWFEQACTLGLFADLVHAGMP